MFQLIQYILLRIMLTIVVSALILKRHVIISCGLSKSYIVFILVFSCLFHPDISPVELDS